MNLPGRRGGLLGLKRELEAELESASNRSRIEALRQEIPAAALREYVGRRAAEDIEAVIADLSVEGQARVLEGRPEIETTEYAKEREGAPGSDQLAVRLKDMPEFGSDERRVALAKALVRKELLDAIGTYGLPGGAFGEASRSVTGHLASYLTVSSPDSLNIHDADDRGVALLEYGRSHAPKGEFGEREYVKYADEVLLAEAVKNDPTLFVDLAAVLTINRKLRAASSVGDTGRLLHYLQEIAGTPVSEDGIPYLDEQGLSITRQRVNDLGWRSGFDELTLDQADAP